MGASGISHGSINSKHVGVKMAATKFKSLIIASEPRLSSLTNLIKESMHKKNLSHRIELAQLDTTKSTEATCECKLARSFCGVIQDHVSSILVIHKICMYNTTVALNSMLYTFLKNNWHAKMDGVFPKPPQLHTIDFGRGKYVHYAVCSFSFLREPIKGQ